MSSPFDLLDDNDDDSSDLDFFFLCHLAKEAEEKEHSSKRRRRRCKRQLHSSKRRWQWRVDVYHRPQWRITPTSQPTLLLCAHACIMKKCAKRAVFRAWFKYRRRGKPHRLLWWMSEMIWILKKIPKPIRRYFSPLGMKRLMSLLICSKCWCWWGGDGKAFPTDLCYRCVSFVWWLPKLFDFAPYTSSDSLAYDYNPVFCERRWWFSHSIGESEVLQTQWFLTRLTIHCC